METAIINEVGQFGFQAVLICLLLFGIYKLQTLLIVTIKDNTKALTHMATVLLRCDKNNPREGGQNVSNE